MVKPIIKHQQDKGTGPHPVGEWWRWCSGDGVTGGSDGEEDGSSVKKILNNFGLHDMMSRSNLIILPRFQKKRDWGSFLRTAIRLHNASSQCYPSHNREYKGIRTFFLCWSFNVFGTCVKLLLQ